MKIPVIRRASRNPAFTLIELLIVVAIIAILAAIAVPNFLEAQTRAKVSRSVSDMRSLATAIESYYVDNNEYPPGNIEVNNPSNGTLVPEYALILPRVARLIPLTTPLSYISSIPLDPFVIKTEPDPASQVYAYWHPAHADAHRIGGAFGTPNLFDDVPGQAENYGAYVFTSSGPDGIVEAPEHQDVGAILNLYDPTNGSVSVGEIWRFR